MEEEIKEIGAASMYIVTKEIYDAKENLYYQKIEKAITDNDILYKHIQYLKDLQDILSNINSI
jgi:hypothetical protein